MPLISPARAMLADSAIVNVISNRAFFIGAISLIVRNFLILGNNDTYLYQTQ